MNPQATLEFLSKFFESTHHDIELRAFPPGRGKCKGRCFTRDVDALGSFFREYSHLETYFGVSTREGNKGTKENCREIPSLYADMDFKTYADLNGDSPEQCARALLDKFPIPPSIIINSGGGFHVHWLLDKPANAQGDDSVERILKGVAEALSADKAVAEKAHVLRPPGTLNHKYAPPREVKLVKADWGLRYSLKDFAFLEPVGFRQTKAQPFQEAKIPRGSHDAELTRIAGKLRHDGMEENAIAAALVEICEKRCEDYGPDYKAMCAKIAHSVCRYPVPEAIEATLPQICIRAGEAPQAADEAEEVLLEHARRLGIFQRGGELVKVIRHEEDRAPRKVSKLRIPEGALRLKPFSAPMLMETLDRIVLFVQWNGRKKDDVRIDCPVKIAVNYLSRGTWRLPHLAGIIAAPLLRPDGTLLIAPGYDEETRLFLETQCEWLPLAEEPTRDEATEALEILRAPFAEFPFVSDEDRAVAIAAVLTALQRRLLMAAPLFGFSAPQPRTGKSHLAEAPALLALGEVPPAFAVSSEDEELRKAFTSILREGYAVVNLDNIERPLRSPELCKIITQEKYGDRLLGENSTLSLPTNCMWTATGNNLAFRGDLAQ